MFDESIWNQPFPFDSGPVNVTVQPGHDEFLDLLDDTFLDDAAGTYEDIKLTSEYHVKTTMKMSKIVEGARLKQANQIASALVIPTFCDNSGNLSDVSSHEKSPSSEVLIKRERSGEAQRTTKTSKAKKVKTTPTTATTTVTSLPPVNKFVHFSIRYVDMYVNVMNSGSFTTIQKFLYKYMSRQSKMVIEHDVRSTFRVPKLAQAEGPVLMAHYFLGCLVMFPDMLVELKGSSTITSTEGRKIVLRVMTHATKSVHLPQDEWIPVMSSLQNNYQPFLEEPLTKTQRQANHVEAELQAQIESSKHIQNFSLEVPSQPGKEQTSSLSCASASGDGEQEQSISSNSSVASVSSLSSTNSAHGRSASIYEDIPLIPESYVKSLYGKAKLLPTPTLLVMKGTITLQLDAEDRICDIISDFVQVNTA